MRRMTLFLFSGVLVLLFIGIRNFRPPQSETAKPRGPLSRKTSTQPIVFEVNEGQADPRIKFLSRAAGRALYLTGNGAVVVLRSPHAGRDKAPETVVQMTLEGANPHPQITGSEKLPGRVNYFIGNDRKEWRTNVSTYRKVRYSQIYPGIDALYYGNPEDLEYDFIVAPGADPEQIRLNVGGTRKTYIDDKGDVILRTDAGDVRLQHPTIYQETGGKKHEIAGGYALEAGTLRFRVASYDHRKPLVIDPVLAYSTYLGGNDTDEGQAVAVDKDGNVYVAGLTHSANFPISGSAAVPAFPGFPGALSAFVTKLNPTTGALIYSTYIGGDNDTSAWALAVDASGNAYVTGGTIAMNFPTQNPVQAQYAGSADVFLSKLNADGSGLLYSTYFGGFSADYGYGIAVDGSGLVYITGSTSFSPSTFFPVFRTTPGVVEPQVPCSTNACGSNLHAFVAKFDTTQSGDASLLYSTYLAGSAGEIGYAIAVDTSGNAYVTGYTASSDFPTLRPLQATCASCPQGDAFVSVLNPTGSSFLYSTFLGGSGFDSGFGIAVDTAGNAYVTGSTSQPGGNGGPIGFPVTSSAFQTTTVSEAAFITKLNPAGSALMYSTYFGNVGTYGTGIGVDVSGNVYIAGTTIDPALPVRDALQPVLKASGSPNAFLARFDPAKSGDASLIYSTYLGGTQGELGDSLAIFGRVGLAVTGSGAAYLSGTTKSVDFPITADAFQPSHGGGVRDAFVTVIAPLTVTVSGGPFIYDGQSHAATCTVTSDPPISGGTCTLTYNGSQTPPTNAGTYTVTATFSGNGAVGSGSGVLVINPAVPTITITGGPFTYDCLPQPVTVTITGISGAAVASMPGSPPQVTYLPGGSGPPASPVNANTYVVNVSFTSGDKNYSNATAQGSLTIYKAMPTVTVTGGTFTYDDHAHGPASVVVTGVCGDTVNGSYTVTYNPTPTGSGPADAGTYTALVTFSSSDSNYSNAKGRGTITIVCARPTINWPPPAPIREGTALSGAQLNAVVNAPETPAYSPPAGTLLNSGAQLLKVVFTPSNSNYCPAARQVIIAVNPSAGSIDGQGTINSLFFEYSFQFHLAENPAGLEQGSLLFTQTRKLSRGSSSQTDTYVMTALNQVVFFDYQDPSAPQNLNSAQFMGTASLNGGPAGQYTFTGKAIDTSGVGGPDGFAITIKDPNGNVVVDISAPIATGNILAH